MELQRYDRASIPNWVDFLATNYADFLYRVYSGKPLPKEKSPTHIVEEMAASNNLFTISDKGRVVGLTAVQLLPKTIDGKTVVFIWEIAVDRTYQGKGLSRSLRRAMIESLSPGIIFGLASNPLSALSRAKITKEYGYDTYWGNLIISGEKQNLSVPEVDKLGRLLLSETPEQMVGYEAGLVPYMVGSVWAREEERVSGGDNLKIVFEKLLAIQKQKNQAYMATLLSIKSPENEPTASDR